LRDPQSLLDWVVATEDAGNRDKIASSVWHSWGKADAMAAVTWVRGLSEKQRDELGLGLPMDSVVERLLKQP